MATEAAADSGLGSLQTMVGWMKCVHFVGFRDDRYWNAAAIFGLPDFIHRRWDKRAAREIDPSDLVVFATGEWAQEPSKTNGDDIDERFL